MKEETLEQAADLLMLRRDTFRIIDGAGPSVDDQDTSSERPAQANLIDEEKASQAPSPKPEQASEHKEVEGQKQPATQPKCTFMGKFPLISSNFRGVVLTWLNAPIVPAPVHFLRTRESSTLNRTSGAKRARLQQNHVGSGAK